MMSSRAETSPLLNDDLADSRPGRQRIDVNQLGAADSEHMITNAATVLAEVDRALGTRGPPAIEYILADSTTSTWSKRLFGRFGHALVRYTMPDGTQKIMNISGVVGTSTVNFVDPSDYFFGTKYWNSSVEQGGIYNRAFWSVRIEKVDDSILEALDAYYKACDLQLKLPFASFKLVGARMKNMMNQFLPFRSSTGVAGNCAWWTSSGLCWINLLQRPRIFPKAIFCELLERQHAINPSNIHVVQYKEIPHAVKVDVPGKCTGNGYSVVTALAWVQNIFYWDLAPFADVVVEVPPGTTEAKVTRRANPTRPPTGCLIRNSHAICVLLLVGWLLFVKGYPLTAVCVAFFNLYVY